MFQNIKSIWGVIGAMLTLIALYLLLTRPKSFATIAGSITSGGNTLARTLQGR